MNDLMRQQQRGIAMTMKQTLALAMGNTPNLFPVLSKKGLLSPSPQWESAPNRQMVNQLRADVFKGRHIPLDRTVWMAPNHTSYVRVVDESHAGSGAFAPENRIKCDALVTRNRDLYLCGIAADCPVLVVEDIDNGIFGIIHTGWVGLNKRIIHKTFSQMINMGAEKQNIQVFVSPFITARNYVGTEWGPREQFFYEYGALYECGEKLHLNMETILRKQLEECGVYFDQVTFDGRCTYTDLDLESHTRTREKDKNNNPFQRGNNVVVGCLPT